MRGAFETASPKTSASSSPTVLNATLAWWPDTPQKWRWTLAWWVFGVVFNVAVFVIWLTADDPDGPEFGGRTAPMFGWYFQYLTIIGGYTQLGYFIHCLIDAYYAYHEPGSARSAGIHYHRDRYFVLSWTITTFICCSYWFLVFDPKATGKILLSSFMHGVSGVVIWVELFVVPHRFGKWIPEVALVLIWAAVYLAWNLVCYVVNDRTFPYEFQKSFTV